MNVDTGMMGQDTQYGLEKTGDNKEVQTGSHGEQVHSSLMYRELKWQKQRLFPEEMSLFLQSL